METRMVARLGVWRAGIWAEAVTARGAMERWRRRAQALGDVETSTQIARSRNQKRKMARTRCSPLDQSSFESLKLHARVRALERRVLRAWASHTQRATQASKQVRVHAQ